VVRRRLIWLMVWTALLAATLGIAVLRKKTSPHEATRVAAAPRILRRGNGAEPESLDPHLARSEAALTILRDLYEGLTELGPGGEPALAAAADYSVSHDGKSYRFHLRSNARWSNGEPLTAEDFAAAWRRLVDPHTGAQYAQLLSVIRGAAAITAGDAAPATLGVHAADDSTLDIDLERPTPYFLALLTHPATFPINRASLQQHGRGFSKPGIMVSNGAFVLTRWDFGSHLIAARNRMYWNDAATQLDGVEYYSASEPSTELRAFRSGELDVTQTIPPAQFAWVQQHMGSELRIAPQLAVYYLGLNLRLPPLADSKALRQALSLAIDRDRLVQSVTGTGERPAYSFVPGDVLNYSPPLPESAHWAMSKRIARARELLAQAGMLQAPPSLELRYNNSELHSRIAVAVASMWKVALGIDTSLRAEEFKVLLQDIDRGDVVQVFRASWLADYDDPFSFLQMLQGGFGINLPHYSNPRYDELLAGASKEIDAESRRGMLQEAEQVMLEDQPLIPLYFYVSKHLVSARIGGWNNNSMNVVYSKHLTKDDGRIDH
jgi:oligopeptide transport system substrate-binding protein